jgi:peptidoglycan/xylan/chitin deacetylase (PgdA/CDA1 family)
MKWPNVLMYHGITQSITNENCIDLGVLFQEHFDNHLKFLKRIFRIITAEEFIENINRKKSFHKNSLLITLDDGYQNVLDYALPIAIARKVPLVAFVSSGHLDNNEWLWFSQLFAMKLQNKIKNNRLLEELKNMTIYEIKKNLLILDAPKKKNSTKIQKMLYNGMISENIRKGIESGYLSIGSHTKDHIRIPNESHYEIKRQIVIDKIRLEKCIGKPIRLFAYPEGLYDEYVLKVVKNAGYVAAFTVNKPKQTTLPEYQNYCIPRIGIYRPSLTYLFLKCVKLFSQN